MMDTATITQHDVIYLHETFHQGDESKFPDYSRGCQCVTNSIASMMLSKIYAIQQWTTEHLNRILKAGDVFYQNICPEERFIQNPGDSGLLEIEDIPNECELLNRHFRISNDESENCPIDVTQISKSLHQICQQTENCDGIILMGDQYGAYASNLMYHNGKVHTFDPHSQSHTTGMPCADGTSVLLTFDSISKFAEYLVQCASIHNAEQVTLCKLIVTTMQQFHQCTDSNLMNGKHQNANLNLHIGKHELSMVYSEVKGDHIKNSVITKCSQVTESEHAKHPQENEDEQKVTFISHSLNLHEEKCKKSQKLICKTCSKTMGNWHNFNLHKTKCKNKYNEAKMTSKCNICSKLLDNNNNLSQHENECKKHHEAAKEIKQKKKKDHYKSTLTTQLKFKYGTILHEENIIIEKLKQTRFKIKDRQCQILKLEEQICAHKKKKNPRSVRITHAGSWGYVIGVPYYVISRSYLCGVLIVCQKRGICGWGKIHQFYLQF